MKYNQELEFISVVMSSNGHQQILLGQPDNFSRVTCNTNVPCKGTSGTCTYSMLQESGIALSVWDTLTQALNSSWMYYLLTN